MTMFRAEIRECFYMGDDSATPQRESQQGVIDAVAKVTHIAPADADGRIIGSPVVAPGVIEYDVGRLGLCAGITGARYTTTTEVYPDSPRATPEQCNAAQMAAVRVAIDRSEEHTSELQSLQRTSYAVFRLN